MLMMFESRSRSEELEVKDASCVDAHQVQVKKKSSCVDDIQDEEMIMC